MLASAAQFRAADDLLEHGQAGLHSVLQALRTHYDQVRPEYERAFRRVPENKGRRFESIMPESPTEHAFCTNLVLVSIFIGPGSLDGICCILCIFRCDWAREHGIGVAIHRRRVLEVAHASDLIQASEYFAEGLE